MSIETLVISHRARGTGEIPNSIASFEKAISLGASGIETDVRITGDKNAVVSHDSSLVLPSGRMLAIAESSIKEVLEGDLPNGKPLTLDELFEFISQTNCPFFIETKVASSELVEQIAAKTKEGNLWDRVNIIGFSGVIGPALTAQQVYPKLRVIPFVNIPLLSYIRHPQKSYGVFIGWLDDKRGSQAFFRVLISPERLAKLKAHYEKLGFKVMAGVVNRPDGLLYFKQAGIRDIVTDEIATAKRIMSS